MTVKRYQDYAIKDGKLVGEFEKMYQEFDDPWEQTKDLFASEKAVALNLIARLISERSAERAIELGCGLGDFTAKIALTGIDATGIDISQTAVAKARLRHPDVKFFVGDISEHSLIESLNPDIIVMAHITWYVLQRLETFLEFIRTKMPELYIIHLLTTYAPGVQKFGREYFTNLDEIMKYFELHYEESGLVQCADGGTRTWFLGRVTPHPGEQQHKGS